MAKNTVQMPSVEVLRSAFSVQPETGILVRKIASSRKFPAGQEAGYINNIGYRQVAFKGRIYSVHRIIWSLYHGEHPTSEVDHINGDRSDNRAINLRHATSSENNQNRRMSSRNKTGIKCVFKVKWAKSWRWRVAVGHGGKKYSITHFVCLGQAVKRANELRSELHREFARAA